MAIAFPKSGLIALIEDIVDTYIVIWDGDPEPFHPVPPKALVYLSATQSTAQGTDEFRSTWDDDTKILTTEQGGRRRVLFRVKVLSYDVNGLAATIIETIRMRLRRPSSRAALNAMDLSLIDCVAIDELAAEKDGRSVMWGTMDVRLNWLATESETIEEGGIIETVNATLTPIVDDMGTPEDESDDEITGYTVTDPNVIPGDLEP